MTRTVEGTLRAYPDTVVGTDSHTTMVNGLGVLGWGVEFHDAEIEKIQERIARQNGYQLVGHSLVLYVKPLD